jgi:hypothetical protein
VNAFMLGAISMGCAVVAVLFLRFWLGTRDRLFLWFALSFLIEAANRAWYGISGAESDATVWYSLVRLLSYGLFLWAILEKNAFGRKR